MDSGSSSALTSCDQLPVELIQQFHGIIWVPTIKGGLSFDLASDSQLLMGDIDKTATHVKLFNADHSEHYNVATSLCTFEDD